MDLYRFVASQKLAVLSSVTRQGASQSALIGIAATSRLEIVFDTLNTSRKYANLRGEPKCSLVIGWTGEQTLQFEGVAQELHGEELAGFQAVYFQAWPECRAHLSWPHIAYFVVRPQWIRFSDYARNPPLMEEFQF